MKVMQVAILRDAAKTPLLTGERNCVHPAYEVRECEPFGFKESIGLRRDQFVMRQRNGVIRHQFVAEHTGFFPR
jgi:peroxiredoxin